MIHVFLGTKAQYIKTAPLLRLMDKRGVRYRLIDTGQHARITAELRKELKIRQPDYFLTKNRDDVSHIGRAFAWFLRNLLDLVFFPNKTFRRVFDSDQGLCIIHGDTLSTLLTLFMAKRCGLKVAHIEAGLRSFRLLDPFPEEIIRIIAMRGADLLFAPSDWAYKNAVSMRLKGKIVNMKVNINWESFLFDLDKRNQKAQPPYCIISIHRTETLFSKKRLSFISDCAVEISKDRKVFFIMHPPTSLALRRFKLFEKMHIPNIEFIPLLSHDKFLAMLKNAEFSITDGGSIQEESHYLGLPCLIMRKSTERQEGLGANALLSNFNMDLTKKFLTGFQNYRVKTAVCGLKDPSEVIMSEISDYA